MPENPVYEVFQCTVHEGKSFGPPHVQLSMMLNELRGWRVLSVLRDDHTYGFLVVTVNDPDFDYSEGDPNAPTPV